MPHYAAHVDSVQREIVETLSALGCSVVCTHAVGMGFSDLVIGYRGQTYLCECKDPKTPNRFTDAQKRFRQAWNGNYIVLTCKDDALNLVLAIRNAD